MSTWQIRSALHGASRRTARTLPYSSPLQYALGYLPVFDSSKVQRELGLRFTPLAVSLRDMVEDMAAKGIAQHPLPGAAAAPTTTAGAAGTGEGAAA